MTLVADILQQAYREGNLLPTGTTPTANELTEALARLNSLIRGFLGFGLGEALAPWLVSQPQRTAPSAADYPQGPLAQDMLSSTYLYPPKNKRLIWNGTAATVYFPEAPNDGSRMSMVQASGFYDGNVNVTPTPLILSGNGYMIEGALTLSVPSCLITSVALNQRNWFFRADTANWVRLTDRVATDTMQFPPEMDDFWIIALAIRLAGRYGKSISKETLSTYAMMKAAAAARYQQVQDAVFGGDAIPNSEQAYRTNDRGWM